MVPDIRNSVWLVHLLSCTLASVQSMKAVILEWRGMKKDQDMPLEVFGGSLFSSGFMFNSLSPERASLCEPSFATGGLAEDG